MRDLTAHVTSSLLHFPEVTVQALGEDEITIDSVLHGKFTGGRSGLACLACGPQLEVVSPLTGERLSAYRFSGVNEQPPTILAVKEFSWQKRTGLLIGLEETEGSVLCLYDLGISRVVKAVVLPGRVTAIEPIINHGGASLTTQHLHQCLRWLFGVAAVVTDVGHVLLIDLCLDDLSCSQNEIEASDLEVITGIPPEIPQIREAITRKGRHLCFQLLNPSGTAVTALSYIHRTNQLLVGFSDGYLSLWNMKNLKKEYHSQLEGGRIPVYAVTFQEPENDPRNFCYLWAIQSTQESEGDVVSFHLLQLAFSVRRRLASGQIMYEGLEYCAERYSLDLTGGIFSLRGQTSNTKLISCQTVEKFRSHVDRDDSINEVISPDTSVTVFSWQVNTYGQGKPLTYLGIFDINRWYHAQMPDSLGPGEFLHDCSYFALWSLDAVANMTSPHRILDVLVHERSLSRGVPPSYPPPEQFFNPTTYNFDLTCLLNSGVVHVTCTGFQKDTLHFLKKSGCFLNEAVPDSYNRCLVAGLLSPRFIDVQPSSLSQEEQLEAVLSAAVQTSSLGLLTSCIKQWTSEEQPDSSSNLHFVLEWTWNKVVNTKEEFVRLCVPLFDGSSNFIDPQTLQSLQHCELLLSNLSTVLNCFVTEAQELTEKGITDLTNKQVVTSLLSQYLQVVIWFCRSSLLPEGLDEDMHLSKPFYNYQHIQRFYAGCRQKLERSSRGKWDPDCLMIDGMISQLGDSVVKLWQRDDGGTGKYPPPSLHALLDLYLLENIEEFYKHATTIYLLLDIMHSCPNKADTSMDTFPTAFAVPIGLVNLIQGFWCLDHGDFENSFTYLFHPATIKLSWQHIRIIQVLMCQGEHRRALRYIQTIKPSMMKSSEVALHLTVLLFNSCMVEAWSVLRQHSTSLNVDEMLKHVYEICQELGLMEDLLKLPFTETEQECLEKFLQTNTGVNNHEFLLVHHLQRANYVPALQLNQSLKTNLMNDRDPRWRERSVARNSILDQYGKILPRVQRKLAAERAKPYHLPSSLRCEVMRPKPLSTVAKPIAAGHIVTKATFINNVLSKIGEVWMGTEQKNTSFQNNIIEDQPLREDSCADRELPDPFVGTPVTKSLRKRSRLLDLVIQPVLLDSSPFGSSLPVAPRASTSRMLPSPMQSSPYCSTLLHKNVARAPEFKLLETPPVVKRAKALTSTSSGFPGFTPQSILRSSLRTTPLASPAPSLGRSITPPLREKETKISFMEENRATEWTTEVTSHKSKHNTVSSDRSHEAQMEIVWPKNREIPLFPACSSLEDDEVVDMSSECISVDKFNKTEPIKDTSNTSVKSDQTTLEYQDAKSPGDLEDEIFIVPHPANSFSKDTTDISESAEREGNEVIESGPLQMEEPTSSNVKQVTEFFEKEEQECHLLPEAEVVVIDRLNAAQDAVVSFVPSDESETNVPESNVRPLLEDNGRLLAETSTKAMELGRTDAESVISIPDSEDIASIHSKDELEEKAMAAHEDRSEEAVEENVAIKQEKMPTNPVSASQELIDDGMPEVQVSEAVAEMFPYNDLCPSNSPKHQYSSDDIEQQVACECLDKNDGECDFTEDDEELLLSQNNFTLILEADEEPKTGDLTVLHHFSLQSASPKSESRYLNSVENNNQECNANSSVVTNDQMLPNTPEVLPYVPEPIQIAIAENLLDVVKDTRSKECSSELVKQSLHESISKKVLSLPQTPVHNALETNSNIVSPVKNQKPSSTATMDQETVMLDVPLPDDQLLTKMDKPDLLVLPTPRRSTRRAKGTAVVPKSLSLPSETESQDDPAHQTPTCPTEDAKKTEYDLEKSTDVPPIAQEFQATITSRRRVKKPKELQEKPSELQEQPPHSLRRTARTKRSLGDQESSQFIIDHTIQMTVNPKRARKLKTIAFQLADNVISEQKTEPHEQQLSVTPKKGRPQRHALPKVEPRSGTEPEKLQLPTPVRSGSRRKPSVPETMPVRDVQPSEQQLPVPVEQETTQSASIAETVSEKETELAKQLPLQRKRGRPRKNPLNISANSELDSSLLSSMPVPQKGTEFVVTPRRNTRSRTLDLSANAGGLPTSEETIAETPKRRYTRVVPAKAVKTSVEKSILGEHSLQPTVASAKTSERRQSKMSAVRKRHHLTSLSEKGTEEDHLSKTMDSAVQVQSTDETKLRLGETGRTLAHDNIPVKKTKYRKKSVSSHISLDGSEAFYFSPPLTKLTEGSQDEKAVVPVQLKELDAGLTSQFVFSPPVLRSRTKQVSGISRIVEELEMPIKEEKESISVETSEKQKVKKSITTRSKATKTSKVLAKDGSWSPPPMELKFISPFGTPADGAQSKKKESVNKVETVIQKTVSRKEKRLSSYPKPVVRKKML